MATATITVSLPDAMKAYVDAHVAAGEFASGEDFLRHLLQEDINRIADAELSPNNGVDAGEKSALAPGDLPDEGVADLLRYRGLEHLENMLLAAMDEDPIRITDDEWQHGNIMQIASERLALRG